MIGSEGPEPLDTTGFPRWWLDAPVDMSDEPRDHPAFNISSWVIDDAEAEMKDWMESDIEVRKTFLYQIQNLLWRVGSGCPCVHGSDQGHR